MIKKIWFCMLCVLLLCAVVTGAVAAISEAERVLIMEGSKAFWEFVTPEHGEPQYIQEDYA